jgi:hypothetical protein
VKWRWYALSLALAATLTFALWSSWSASPAGSRNGEVTPLRSRRIRDSNGNLLCCSTELRYRFPGTAPGRIISTLLKLVGQGDPLRLTEDPAADRSPGLGAGRMFDCFSPVFERWSRRGLFHSHTWWPGTKDGGRSDSRRHIQRDLEFGLESERQVSRSRLRSPGLLVLHYLRNAPSLHSKLDGLDPTLTVNHNAFNSFLSGPFPVNPLQTHRILATTAARVQRINDYGVR